MSRSAAADRLAGALGAWADSVGLGPTLREEIQAGAGTIAAGDREALRPPATAREIRAWERRYGFRLPADLRAWLRLSDGLYRDGPLIHPLTAIGPMIPFARMPDLFVQPESWFELGNPGDETVCIDLGYRWPGGDFPLFASGDDEKDRPPRLIATSFRAWFLRLCREGGKEYWMAPTYPSLGDPWEMHRRHVPVPPLPDRLRPLAARVLPLMNRGADERTIAAMLGITRPDLEALFRHIQHTSTACGGA